MVTSIFSAPTSKYFAPEVMTCYVFQSVVNPDCHWLLDSQSKDQKPVKKPALHYLMTLDKSVATCKFLALFTSRPRVGSEVVRIRPTPFSGHERRTKPGISLFC